MANKFRDLDIVQPIEDLGNYHLVVSNPTKDARVTFGKLSNDILKSDPKVKALVDAINPNVDTDYKWSFNKASNAWSLKPFVLPTATAVVGAGIEFAAQIPYNPNNPNDITNADLLAAFKATPTDVVNGLRIGIFKNTLAATEISRAGLLRSLSTIEIHHGTMLLFRYANDVVTNIYVLKHDTDIFNRIDEVENKIGDAIPLWLPNVDYKVGKVVRHSDNKIYVVNANHNTPAFDTTKFDGLSIEVGGKGDKGDKGDTGPSGNAVDKFDMQNAKVVPFANGQIIQATDIHTIFKLGVPTATLHGFYPAYFSNEGVNPLGVQEPFLDSSAVLNYTISGISKTSTVSQGVILKFEYVNNVLVNVEVLDDARLYRTIRNEIKGKTIYNAANPSGQKMVSAMVKAVDTTATVEQIVAHGKKAVLLTLPSLTAGIESIEMFFDDVQSAKDVDNSLYIALKVAVPTITNQGRKFYPKLESVMSADNLFTDASPTNNHTFDYLHDGQVQRSLYAAPTAGSDFIVYRLLGMGAYDTAMVTFGRFM
jgi:hypothetical protein